MNVLITGCSKHSSEVIDCLKNNEDGIEVKVTAVNMDSNKLLRHETDYQYVVPPITDESYLECLLNICTEREIDVIIPYITAELQLLADNRDFFERYGIAVSVADPEALSIVNSKEKLYELYSIYMPEQYVVSNSADAQNVLNKLGYPDKKVCCKITGKCGGTGFCILDEEKCYDISLFNKCGVNRYIGIQELYKILENGSQNIILQEYISGEDYSVCILADHGKVLQAVGYVGYDMAYGAVVNGMTKSNNEAIRIAEDITSDTGLDGNACFDFIISEDGRAYLLECNPRINATIGLCRAAGVNLIWERCKQLAGMNVSERLMPKEGLRVQKYYESEYYV